MIVDIKTLSGKVFRGVEVLNLHDADDETKLHKFVYSETVTVGVNETAAKQDQESVTEPESEEETAEETENDAETTTEEANSGEGGENGSGEA